MSSRLDFLSSFTIETLVVKPGRKTYVVKPEDLRSVFSKMIEVLGDSSFYVSTIIGTDLKDEGRIRLDYYVVVLPEEETIVLRTFIPRDNPSIDSLIDLIPGVLPGECETHDLLGVVFKGNPFLKRGFFVPSDIVEQGKYPLRKDSGV
ncbi:NADH-quinone oxidoreductase subunit C [Thermosphaera sp.]